ncbi:hypothetical protein Mchl_4824 [Methylorubrum extorquens CM4]|uniref:Uncharacterized protein n=1 Tax=Methylorubrum extorquens (strain CM4 / NCIMB 13688) TaxID=440085 RepID=B7KRR7_METC4|nr:hypothetical protein Mchl_4824 [Methylorubrum extorquens CM4]
MLRVHLDNVHIGFIQGIEAAGCMNAFAKKMEFSPVSVSSWVCADAT